MVTYRITRPLQLRLDKTIGGLRKSRFIGREKLDFQFGPTMAAYNLVRMRNLGVGVILMAKVRGVDMPGSRQIGRKRAISAQQDKNRHASSAAQGLLSAAC